MRAGALTFALVVAVAASVLRLSAQRTVESVEPLEACGTGAAAVFRPAVAAAGDLLRADAIPRVVEADFSGSIRLVAEIAGDVDAIEVETVVVAKGVSLPRQNVRRTRTGRIFGTSFSMFEISQHLDIPALTSTGQAGTLTWGDFSPILFRVRLGGEVKGFTTVSVVPSAGVSAAPVRRINDAVQYSSHVINVRSRAEIEGRAIGDRDFPIAADEMLRETVYRNFRDVFDQTVLVTGYGFTWRYSGYFERVRNAIGGIGLPALSPAGLDTAGSRVRQGRIVIRDTLYSDLALHEIAHQWGDAFNWQAIAGQRAADVPHTPLWGLFESPLSTKLPMQLFLAHRDGAWKAQVTESPRFPPLYLYAMGRLDRNDVPDIPFFLDQQQQPTLTVDAGGEVRAISIDDVIRVHDERTGPRVDRWRAAIVIVTPDRLLDATEMSFYNYVSQRMSDPEQQTWLVPTFEKMTGAVLDTRIEPLEAEPLDAPRFDPVPAYTGRDVNWMTIDTMPAILTRDRRHDVRGLIDGTFLALSGVSEVSFSVTPSRGGTPRRFAGAVNSSGAFVVSLDVSTFAPGRYSVAVLATNVDGRFAEERFGPNLEVVIR